MRKNLIFIALLIIGFTSCNNNTEQGPLPSISNYTVSADHEGGHRVLEAEIVVVPGEEAVIAADLSGASLSTVQLDIHWAGGHEHRLNTVNQTSKQWNTKIVWRFGEEGGLSPEGVFPNSHHLHEHVDIPTTVDGDPIEEGDYHFVLHLWDKEGNETQKALTVEIHSEHEGH